MNSELKELTKRIPGTGDFISFDNTVCNNCERCVIICIMNLWRKREEKIYLSNDYTTKCLECAACFQVCDAGAITFKYPAGGTGIIIEKG